jgi:hypothetical protein
VAQQPRQLPDLQSPCVKRECGGRVQGSEEIIMEDDDGDDSDVDFSM